MSKSNFVPTPREGNIVHRNDLPDISVYEYVKDGKHHIVVGEENAKGIPGSATRVVAKHLLLKSPAVMYEVNFAKGTRTPMHAHEVATLMYVVKGRLRSQVGTKYPR